MQGSNVEETHPSSFDDFYRGKSVFITGAAGFVGSILIETLLRCCPEIKTIFILLRSKKNVEPETRKEQIFSKKIFEKFLKESPEVLEKVHVIAGDVSLPKLGMNEEDIQLLVDEVSIVFHCAAVISFIKPLKFTLANNVLSVNRVIELCRQMRKFECLVYTSTAYSNSNLPNLLIKEEIHRLPVHAEKFLDALKNEDNETLQELITRCKPDWPNSYTFSKCLAENVIMDTASDLPIAIVRPSIIICTCKNPMLGYAEGNSGLMSLTLGIGKGFIKVGYADPHCKVDLIPVDIVANTHLIAAWSVGTKCSSSPLVVNCTATENYRFAFREKEDSMAQMVRENPFPQSFEQPSNIIIVSYKYLYYILAAYYHYLPAIFFDAILKISGKKLRLLRLYRFLDTVMMCARTFLFVTFEFERKNMEILNKLISFENRQDLSLDFRDTNFLEITLASKEVCQFYDWKIDRKSKSERLRTMYRRHMLIICIQRMFVIACCLLFYWLFSFIFR